MSNAERWLAHIEIEGPLFEGRESLRSWKLLLIVERSETVVVIKIEFVKIIDNLLIVTFNNDDTTINQ
jgi:hypothetical protein